MQEKLHKYKAVGEINSILKKRKRDSKDSLEEQILSSSAPEESLIKHYVNYNLSNLVEMVMLKKVF